MSLVAIVVEGVVADVVVGVVERLLLELSEHVARRPTSARDKGNKTLYVTESESTVMLPGNGLLF